MKNGPVYTIENECQDCYKCVRHCPCKAIQIIDAKASVIQEACVACGMCVRVCPAHAKLIRSDLARLKQLLSSGAKVYASVAPSYRAYFPGVTLGQLTSTLLSLGFAGVSETAIGAQAVSAETAEFLRTTELPLVISSACPAAVDYIRKYHPEFTANIAPVHSPVLAHCRLLKQHFGDDIKVVFIGPCAAKKNEADRMPELLSLAVTFQSFEKWLEDEDMVMSTEESPLAGEAADEGRFYAIEGGMNDTIREAGAKVRYLAVSGLENLDRMLSQVGPLRPGGRTLFIEALACHGGCINGPVMQAGAASLDAILDTDATCDIRTSAKFPEQPGIGQSFRSDKVEPVAHTEDDIAAALARVGKFSKADELNCGACGYNTCRDFAKALLENKAEEAMCHNYLRKNFERTSNALIRFIPAAVVMVDASLDICDCNRNFAKLVNMTDVYGSLGNLNTIPISSCLPDFAELFSSVIENGGEIEKFNQKFNSKIINISVFTVAQGKVAGAVIQDVTQNEFHREQIAEKAREVIRKNVITVQQVARLFGEHVADTEILLNEIAGTYEAHGEEKKQG